MKKNTVLRTLNLILLVMFVNQAATVLFREELPIWAFRFFHMGGGAILLGLIAMHLALNLNWVRANYLPKAGS